MLLSSDEEEYDNLEAIKIVNFTRIFIRITSYPLNLPDRKFIKDIRLSKEAFTYLLNEVVTIRSTSVPPIIKLAATFFAEGGCQEGTGNDFVLGLAQPTLSKILFASKKEHLYYNRKGFYSLNAMIICDHQMMVMILLYGIQESCEIFYIQSLKMEIEIVDF